MKWYAPLSRKLRIQKYFGTNVVPKQLSPSPDLGTPPSNLPCWAAWAGMGFVGAAGGFTALVEVYTVI